MRKDIILALKIIGIITAWSVFVTVLGADIGPTVVLIWLLMGALAFIIVRASREKPNAQ